MKTTIHVIPFPIWQKLPDMVSDDSDQALACGFLRPCSAKLRTLAKTAPTYPTRMDNGMTLTTNTSIRGAPIDDNTEGRMLFWVYAV